MKIFMITITAKNIPGEWREISGIVSNLNPTYLSILDMKPRIRIFSEVYGY